MKILHVCHHFYPCTGGIENYVYNLCKNLIKLGHQTDVVCLDKCGYGKEHLKPFEEYDGIKIYRIPFLNLKFYNIAPHVFSFIKNYDIIHIHSIGFFSDFLILTQFLHKKKLVLNTHSGIFHTKRILWIKNIYFNLWCKFLLRNIELIVGGEYDRKLFSQISSNINLVPITIDVKKFLKIKRSPEKNALVYIGRIATNKRIDNLIKTLSFVKKKIPEVKLYIVGRDWEGLKSDLLQLAKDNGVEKNVIFTGEVTERELLNYLKIAYLYVFASEYEGAAVISVLEAMATGCPVVINKIIRDTSAQYVIDKKTGFVVNYEEPEKAAEEVIKLLNKDLSGISKHARTAVKEYDWEISAKKIEKIYKRLLEAT